MSDNLYQNPEYLSADQYRDSDNLTARADLHRRFGVEPRPWHPWVFDHLNLQLDTAVLECGCGPGWLWRENLERIPAGCRLTLTDLSPGMVAEAEAALSEAVPDEADYAFRFQPANVEALPFDDDQFDVVVANHMLYHVPHLDKALAEIRRVLKPDGRFFAATNGETHMKELEKLAEAAFPREKMPTPSLLTRKVPLAFRLENGRELLQPHFDHITRHDYDSRLEVTEVEPLIAYVLSGSEIRALVTDDILAQSRAFIADIIAAEGAYHITKETGLFEAWE